jgi:hypothetical protein
MSGLELYKNICLCFSNSKLHEIYVSTVYRVTQKDFYARPHTSMWAPVVARQISKCIIDAVELVTPHMLINTWQLLEYRLDICRATTGAHIEVYGCA